MQKGHGTLPETTGTLAGKPHWTINGLPGPTDFAVWTSSENRFPAPASKELPNA